MNELINITEARELFSNTTQGEWKTHNNHFLISEDGDIVLNAYDTDTGVDQSFNDLYFAMQAHKHWPAMLEELERLRAEAKCTIEAIGGDTAELDVALENRIPLDSMVSEAMSQKDDEIERLRATIKEITSIGVVRGEDILGGRWVRKDEIDDVTKEVDHDAAQPIDEVTHVPAFVGDDEIEVAGVIYVRKGSQQSQPVNVRLLNAAKKYRSLSRSADFDVQDELSNSITAAEAQIAERELTVTLNDAQAQFGTSAVRVNSSTAAITVRCEVDIKTSGDVLDLLRMLGGAT